MELLDFRLKFNLHTLPKAQHFPSTIATHMAQPLRKAAVLVALKVHNGELELILTRRPSHLRQHPGQISFPGGKVEKTDISLEATALREADEEIGLTQQHVQVIGLLDDHQTFTGFDITPVVSIVTQPYTPVIDAGEVDELFTIPLSFLLKADNRHIQYFNRGGVDYPVHFIPYGEYFIWGATAAMIDQLCRLIGQREFTL